MTPDNSGWIKCCRGPDGDELLEANPMAYILATIIARRARWRDSGLNRYNLAVGEAMLGDYRRYGMTEQQYRTAKAHLEKWGFATFRATNQGTVGKLTDSRLYIISDEPNNGQNNTQITDEQRAGNGQATGEQRLTKKERIKEGKKERKEEDASPSGWFEESKDARVTLTLENFPTLNSDPVFCEAWIRWTNYRKQIKHALSEYTREEQLRNFEAWGVGRSVAAINHTIRMGWRGLREPEATPQRANPEPKQIKETITAKTL